MMTLKNWIKDSIKEKISKLLDIVDQTCLTGPMKAWIVNHHVCAKIAWSLMIYDFPDSAAREWQAILQRYFRDWIGLNATTEPSILYRHTEHFGLNLNIYLYHFVPCKLLDGIL